MKVVESYHERRIRNAVRWFFIGCIGFILIQGFLIYLGIHVFIHPESGLPKSLWLLAFGSILLLIQMLAALNFRMPLNTNYKPMDDGSYPMLTSLIGEITRELELQEPRGVYLAPGLGVAVFSRPTMWSIMRNPEQELVIGELLLRVLSKEELRVVLYHEFGHFNNGALNRKIPIYVISQFSKSFTAIKKMRNSGVWDNVIHGQVDLFSYFAYLLFSMVDKHYQSLAQGEEYKADDIAVQYTSKCLLTQTLLKVALLRHYDRYLGWVSQRLGMRFEEVERDTLLLFLCKHHIGLMPVPLSLWQRIERYGDCQVMFSEYLQSLPDVPDQTDGIYRLLLNLHPKYEERQLRNRSVKLFFHLDRRKHKVPWVEGKYQILLDGKRIGDGNFIKGFDFSVRTCPGKHIVSVYGISGISTIPYEFTCREGDHLYIDMDFKLYFRNGYYEVFVASSEIISSDSDRNGGKESSYVHRL